MAASEATKRVHTKKITPSNGHRRSIRSVPCSVLRHLFDLLSPPDFTYLSAFPQKKSRKMSWYHRRTSRSEGRERTRPSRASPTLPPSTESEQDVDRSRRRRQRNLTDTFSPPCAKTAAYQIHDGVKYCWRRRK